MKHLNYICGVLLLLAISLSIVACTSAAKPVAISAENYSSEFALGDEFGFDGIVKLQMSDGSFVEYTDYFIDSTDYKKSENGIYRITIGSKEYGLFYKYYVTVGNDRLFFSGQKTDFEFGEEFSCDGLVVEKHDSDGNTTLNPNHYTIDSSEYNPNRSGSYTIRVTADSGETGSYVVTVKKTSGLHVLVFGNSYTQDSTSFLYRMAKSAGMQDMVVVNMFIGGCSVSTHYNNIANDVPAYSMEIRYGDDDTKAISRARPSDAFKYADWDIIVMNQASASSGLSERYGEVQSIVGLTRRKINEYGGNEENVRFAWQMCWAYDRGSFNAGFANYNNDQDKMYSMIVNAVKNKVAAAYDIIMPVGTAIQNARTSPLGEFYSRDSADHLNVCGRYIAGLTLFSALTGEDLQKVTYLPEGVESSTADILKRCVSDAIAKPFEVTTYAKAN